MDKTTEKLEKIETLLRQNLAASLLAVHYAKHSGANIPPLFESIHSIAQEVHAITEKLQEFPEKELTIEEWKRTAKGNDALLIGQR